MRIGSLFSGIGGLELGLEWANVGETVWQVEQDAYCQRVLAKHWPNATRYDDVRTVGAHNLESVDVICGGFPCQDVSKAGKRVGLGGARSGLWFEFARIVGEMAPEYVVVENVTGLFDRGFGDVLGALAAFGYDAEWSVISACSLGAPHTRERVFVVAYAQGERPGQLRRVGSPSPRQPQRHLCWPSNEPPVARMVDGVPYRSQRCIALGNAVVPQCAEVVGRRLLAIHAERCGVAA